MDGETGIGVATQGIVRTVKYLYVMFIMVYVSTAPLIPHV